jgi:hypothetical protein
MAYGGIAVSLKESGGECLFMASNLENSQK